MSTAPSRRSCTLPTEGLANREHVSGHEPIACSGRYSGFGRVGSIAALQLLAIALTHRSSWKVGSQTFVTSLLHGPVTLAELIESLLPRLHPRGETVKVSMGTGKIALGVTYCSLSAPHLGHCSGSSPSTLKPQLVQVQFRGAGSPCSPRFSPVSESPRYESILLYCERGIGRKDAGCEGRLSR
jgi:hypothetical protein